MSVEDQHASSRSLPLWILLLLHVVTQQDILVAEIKFATGDHRMRPTVILTAVALMKATSFLVALRSGVDQHDCSLVAFAAQIKLPIGAYEGALAQFTFFLPHSAAGFEFLANPTFALRVAVQMLPHTHDAAMMVHHVLVTINFFRPKF